MIEYVEGQELKIFTDYVEGVTPEDQRSVAGFGLIDLTRQAIFNSALLIRAYFSLFADIAQMLVTVSADYLQPGASILDKISSEVQSAQPTDQDKPNSPALINNIAELKKWTTTATTKISEMAKSVRESIILVSTR